MGDKEALLLSFLDCHVNASALPRPDSSQMPTPPPKSLNEPQRHRSGWSPVRGLLWRLVVV